MKSTFTAALLLVCVITSSRVLSQGQYKVDTGISVKVNGNTLKFPWAGGFNAPIFSEIDMNGDGIKDLFVFEKDGNRISTFINNGTANTVDYVYAPEYRNKFPKELHDWVLLYDYNCDGKEDIFTYASPGMAVYRNDYSVASGLKFNMEYSLVKSWYGANYTNLYVASVNLPALVDVDYDGDLDVLTFPVSGNFVEYHENKGVEYFNKCDTLVYEINPNCFGNFGLSSLTNSGILNLSCRQGEPQPPGPGPVVNSTMHSGSCMIAFDVDGDFDRDILNGDILGNNLLMLYNGGDSTYANMNSQDTAYPSYNTPAYLITFPSPYYIDVNNDGNKDLVVAPCISGSAENYNNVLFYRNTTNNNSNIFDFQQNRFLVDQMIEVGTGANVTFVDIDSDGLKDIIIGNNGYFMPTPPFESGLAYYRNTGTATAPEFTFQTNNFANLFALPVNSIDPAFGDIDNDGDDDLILGNLEGTLIYYENIAGQGNPPNYFFASGAMTDNTGTIIDVGHFSSPQIIDVNRDGKLDLLVGERLGTINYYENTGTAFSPVFTLVTSTFGNLNVTSGLNLYGYSNPCLYDSAGTYQLLVGSVTGYIYQYNNIDNNLGGSFTLVDSMFYNIEERMRSTVDVADINGDGINEIIVGNNAGGVALYKFEATSDIPEPQPYTLNFTLYPNPASDEVFLKFNSGRDTDRTIEFYDIAGKLTREIKSDRNVVVLDTKTWAKGVYTCRVIDGQEVKASKFVIGR